MTLKASIISESELRARKADENSKYARIASILNELKAKGAFDDKIVARSILLGHGISISDIEEFDLTGKEDGAVFIYNAEKQKFELKRNIENPNITILGGAF